jgi:SAM-dependent methyltransferase
MAAEAATLRLLARVRRRFAVVTDEVAFGPVRFGFTRVADPNRVLDEVAAEEDRRERTTGQRHKEPLLLPYWAELWDSGGGVATQLAERYATEQSRAVSARGERSSHLALAGHTVLDLGCGQGLLGCVAASLGARVTFADLEPPALLFARLNAAALGRRAVAVRPDRRGRHPLRQIAVAPPGAVLAGAPGAPRPRAPRRARPAERRHVPRLASRQAMDGGRARAGRADAGSADPHLRAAADVDRCRRHLLVARQPWNGYRSM